MKKKNNFISEKDITKITQYSLTIKLDDIDNTCIEEEEEN